MKKIFLATLACFAFLLSSNAQHTTKKVTAAVKNGDFTIGTAVLTKDWEINPLMTVLDKKNDRRRAGYNTTHTFDKLGMVIFEKNDEQKLPSGTVNEVQFYFALTDTNGVVPKQLFEGVLKIENLKLTGNETPEIVKEKLKDYKVTDSYMPHNFRLAYKGLYIYFLFNKEEDKLLKVSIGKDTRN